MSTDVEAPGFKYSSANELMFKPLLKLRSTKFPLYLVLVVAFVAQTVAMTGLVGYISFRSGRRAVDDLASQLRLELTARVERELRSYFEVPHQFDQVNTAALSEGQLDLSNGEGALQFLQQIKISPFIDHIYCGDTQGNFLGVSRRMAPNAIAPQFVMSTVNAQTNYQMQVYSLDNKGNRKFLLEDLGAYDPRLRPWFKSAIWQERPVWSDVYLDFSSLSPTITSSRPVFDKTDRRILGICATDVLLTDDLREFLSDILIGETGQAFVMDRSGQIISSSTNEPLTVGEGSAASLIQAVESSEILVRASTQFLQQHFGSLSAIQSSQQLDFKVEGQRQYLQVLPIRDVRGLDWLIVVTLPEADFMAEIYANTRNSIILTLAALTIAIAVGILIARFLTRPIRNVTLASQTLAHNLNQRVAEQSTIAEVVTLAKSFNGMAGQLNASFATLEEKVADRTSELEQANQQISQLNQKLRAENLRLTAEIDVARQIQARILPKAGELDAIPGLDITGYMQPADEVGGDYYDVLAIDGIVTIGIGDVTGHGLESGLLMLMTQTAVRTLKEVRERDPVRFLDTLNRTIYQNVQRMNSDRNLTLAILNYEQGRISISGQHEELLVVRASGQVERIDTIDLGLPIGLDDDIADFISHQVVQLQPGDGVVLYTDGIPEAYNSEKKQYGLERLCTVISLSWSGTATEIKQAIINDVQSFIGEQRIFDDITLLVLKQQPELI
ncbi:MAG: SpoIIE family protein phosphatase [Cyanobacteria bacterium P01_H01_bin.121]